MNDVTTCTYHPEQIAAFLLHEKTHEKYYSMGNEPTGSHHGYMLLSTSCGHRRVAPVLCSDPFCVPCEKAKAANRRKRWLPILQAMKEPKLITLTLPSGEDLAERFTTLKLSFRSLMGLRLGPRNKQRLQAASLSFVKEHYQKLVDSGEVGPEQLEAIVTSWTVSLDRFWSWVDGYKRKNNKWPLVRNIIGKGFAVLEITFSKGLWHPHRHLTVDSKYIPWPLLCAAWLQVTDNQAKIVDIRSVGKTAEDQKELIKYLAKTWDVPEDKRDDFRQVVRGLKRVWPLGKAHPIDEHEPCPYCGNPACKSHVTGSAVLIQSGNMWGTSYKVFELDDYTHSKIVMIFNSERGRWLEAPLLDTLRNCASFAATRRGPPI
jgi:hypothetical protein